MSNLSILTTESEGDYALLDSGEGEKLERFGKVVLSRPDPQALWQKRLPAAEWKKADGYFTRSEKQGDWDLKSTVPDRWSIDLGGLKFSIKPTAFKHVGLFPEQISNWDWVREVISKFKSTNLGKSVSASTIASPHIAENLGEASLLDAPLSAKTEANSRGVSLPAEASAKEGEGDAEPTYQDPQTTSEIEILNLFGYTGGATLAAAQAGAKVVHIDGSKVAMNWARDNAELSGLKDKPVRWILEDAPTFVKREIKRGRKYAGIIMDPPAFGHGPEGEVWKIEEDFLPLVEDCFKLLSDKPLFFLINGYSAGYSAIAYENVLMQLKNKFGGDIEVGELVVKEEVRDGMDSRSLPCGIFARWKN